MYDLTMTVTAAMSRVEYDAKTRDAREEMRWDKKTDWLRPRSCTSSWLCLKKENSSTSYINSE